MFPFPRTLQSPQALTYMNIHEIKASIRGCSFFHKLVKSKLSLFRAFRQNVSFIQVYNDHPANDHEALYQLHLNVPPTAALGYVNIGPFYGVTVTSSGRESCV